MVFPAARSSPAKNSSGRSPIQLVFYQVVRFDGEPVNRIFEQIRWEKTALLATYDFLEGDIEFVKKLARGA